MRLLTTKKERMIRMTNLRSVSKAEKEKWAQLLDKFFERQEDIAHVFTLVDLRHKPTADDMQMQEFLNYRIMPFTVVATKADKLSRMKQKEQVRSLATYLKMGVDNIIPVSGETGQGKTEILAKISHVLALQSQEEEEFDGEE